MQILIISEEEDFHAKIVSHRLSGLGADCVIWNTRWHPWRDAITWTGAGVQAVTIGGTAYDLAGFTSIWWRRFGPPRASPDVSDPAVEQFVRSEASAALRGLVETHPRVHNPIRAEIEASNKLRQLNTALALGLSVPATIISNDAAAIRAFAARHGACIIKTVAGDYPHGIATRRLSAEELADDAALTAAPSIIQEEIGCDRDIRVTIIGGEVFAAELTREDAADEVDWRKSPHGWAPHRLPDTIRARLLRMMRHLGLHMASFDLRLDRAGRHVFFEVNPSGQFMFLEIDAGLAISEAVARLLCNPAAPE